MKYLLALLSAVMIVIFAGCSTEKTDNDIVRNINLDNVKK